MRFTPGYPSLPKRPIILIQKLTWKPISFRNIDSIDFFNYRPSICNFQIIILILSFLHLNKNESSSIFLNHFSPTLWSCRFLFRCLWAKFELESSPDMLLCLPRKHVFYGMPVSANERNIQTRRDLPTRHEPTNPSSPLKFRSHHCCFAIQECCHSSLCPHADCLITYHSHMSRRNYCIKPWQYAAATQSRFPYKRLRCLSTLPARSQVSCVPSTYRYTFEHAKSNMRSCYASSRRSFIRFSAYAPGQSYRISAFIQRWWLLAASRTVLLRRATDKNILCLFLFLHSPRIRLNHHIIVHAHICLA